MCVLQRLVEKQVDVVVCIVYKAERRYAARFQSQIFHHSFRRGKRQFAARRESSAHERLLETVLKVVYVKIVVTVEAYEVVAVAFVVAEEKILAVHAAVIFPPTPGLFYGLPFGVVVVSERYVVFTQIIQYCFFPCHGSCIDMDAKLRNTDWKSIHFRLYCW